MDSDSKAILDLLSSRKHNMIEQLHQFCSINSSTDNLPGLAKMHQSLANAYESIAYLIETRVCPPVSTINMKGELFSQPLGNALLIRKRPEQKTRILLSGHMDTVYPMNSVFQSLKYINENKLNGPGVSDMKGGLIVMLQALSAFEETEASKLLGWDVLINADEEIGSPGSSVLFEEIAKNYQAALVFEPAMNAEGIFAKNRKGSGKLTLVATGKSAHAGRDFDKGRNAICYLAKAIIAISELNGQREGVTINVGKVTGGEALNVVPDKAVAKLDIRISHTQDEAWVFEKINAIIEHLKHKDYSLTLHGSFGRPVKKISAPTERLFKRLCLIGKKLGLEINWQDSGGCCDGNNLAHFGLPVIDTLGVRGGLIHSHDEFILLDSLVERAQLSTLLLIDLANGGLMELNS